MNTILSHTKLRILAATYHKPKSVREIAYGLDLPLKTVYRYVDMLVQDELLLVDQKRLTNDGKRETLLISNVEGYHMDLNRSHLTVTVDMRHVRYR